MIFLNFICIIWQSLFLAQPLMYYYLADVNFKVEKLPKQSENHSSAPPQELNNSYLAPTERVELIKSFKINDQDMQNMTE